MSEAKEKKDEAVTPGAALTRREWLLSLGSAVVLSGFRGVPAEAAREGLASRAPLPPGLYHPSLDHLTHALSSEGQFVSAPPTAETEYVRPRSGSFIPQAFAPNDFAVIRRLVEIILGEDLRTASEKPDPGAPGSIYDEVAEWIDLVISSAPAVRKLARNLPADQRALAVAFFGSEEPVLHLETFEPERICRDGLAWLGEESQRRFAKSFLSVTASDQAELVKAISDVRPERSTTHAGTRLFDFLKEETVRGFYTSRRGLKELDYKGNSFYGESPGCTLPLRSTASELE
jgi:gluconate 2-dehydrogenase subunit 3-like protein